jgi:hypothetical protein
LSGEVRVRSGNCELKGEGKKSLTQSRRVTTAEILAKRALEMSCGQDCLDWAATLLIEGHDTHYLRMLAGKLPPHNHFEIAALRDRALDELGVSSVSREDAVCLYAAERLRSAIAGETDLQTEMAALAQLCIDANYARSLFDFYLLSNASEDLETSDMQWYWPDATRSNILQIMRNRAEEFVREAETKPVGRLFDAPK